MYVFPSKNRDGGRGFAKFYSGMRQSAGFLSVVAILGASSAFAEDQVERDPASKEVRVRNAGDPEKRLIPESIRKLKLSNEQNKKIEDIADSYDKSISAVLKQFSDQYMKTIAMETSMLAAIEDGFTEEQRTRVRDARRKIAQYETNSKPAEKSSEPNKQVDVVKEELANTGVTLTSEQQDMADAIQLKYRNQLRQQNQRILELHKRLISLEGEKLSAIEKELTKDQLSELRANRKAAQAESTAVSHTTKSNATE